MARQTLHPRRRRALQHRLIEWYRRARRDLPWRGAHDPYAVWVSEIMLQQTRVETVRPYYERFLKRFPDPAALARAPLDEVLKAWEGLGYYGRARNLHRAARRIVDECGGKLPRTVKALLGLPGVGRYTAGAIASIAFGLDEPVLDGNVARVLCRLELIRQDPRRGATRRRLWSLTRQLVPPGEAATMNQAMMDLGAMVCTPRQPDCPHCPLNAPCKARAAGQQDRLPRRAAAKPLPHHAIVAGVIRRGRRILIDRRKPDGLLGGLWEFPGGKVEPGETLQAALRREVREELDVEIAVGRPIAVVEHAYSHFRITLHAFQCRYVSGTPKALGCDAFAWVLPEELERYAFPAANQRIIAALAGAQPARRRLR